MTDELREKKGLILGILGRGYCTKRNSHKIVDPDLIEDMVDCVLSPELLKLLAPEIIKRRLVEIDVKRAEESMSTSDKEWHMFFDPAFPEKSLTMIKSRLKALIKSNPIKVKE